MHDPRHPARGLARRFSILLCLSVLVVASVSDAAEPGKRKLRVIAYGDNEGVLRRPGRDPHARNEIHQKFLEELKELDARERIDLILHTGDVVRFDPGPDLLIQQLGPLLSRFYPTTGGDEEFQLGRYAKFMEAVPHLKELLEKRIQEDHNQLEYYYYVEKGGLYVISLFNPDDYGEREYRSRNPFLAENAKIPQLVWLVKTLEKIRSHEKDAPIIVLSHRPVLNQSRYLTSILDRFGVSLVLSADVHAYAKGRFGRTLYLLTGIMGDIAVGGCDAINDHQRRDFQVRYEICVPEARTIRFNTSEYMLDHYLDLAVSSREIDIKAITLRDHQVFDSAVQNFGGP